MIDSGPRGVPVDENQEGPPCSLPAALSTVTGADGTEATLPGTLGDVVRTLAWTGLSSPQGMRKGAGNTEGWLVFKTDSAATPNSLRPFL